MAKKRSRKKTKKKRIRFHKSFILPFIITLTAAVALGVLALAAHQWIMEPVKTKTANEIQSDYEKEKPETDRAEIEENDTSVGEGTEPAAPEEEPETVSKYQEELDDPAYMEENNIYSVQPVESGKVTMAFAGDVLFDDHYAITGTVRASGDISQGIMPEVMERMQAADIMMLNNEFAYSNRGTPLEEKQFTFRARPETAAYLTDLGVDIVSLANNHAYDYGPEALEDTLDTLRETGIPYVGAGRDIGEARKPVYYIVGDIKIAFVSATQIERLDTPDTKEATETSPGVFRCFNGEKLLQTVAAAKEESDFVIVYVHWGTENQEETDWAQNKQAPELVEAGADLIIGDHPHILQKIDIINGVPVIYSLGNFWFNSRPLDTGMVKVTISQEGLQSFQFIPCLQNNCKTNLLEGEEKTRVLGEMRRMSPTVQIDEDGYVTLP